MAIVAALVTLGVVYWLGRRTKGWSHLGNPDSNKEKQIWVIREKKTKARGNNRKKKDKGKREQQKMAQLSPKEKRKQKKEKKSPASAPVRQIGAIEQRRISGS
jgi:hypothetical protein